MTRLSITGCRACRTALWDYAEERLSEGRLEMVERHLRRCPGCRADLASVRRARRTISAYNAFEIPGPRGDWESLRVRLEPVAAARALAVVDPATVDVVSRRSAPISGRVSSLLFAAAAGMLLATAAIGYRLSPANRNPVAATERPTAAAAATSEPPVRETIQPDAEIAPTLSDLGPMTLYSFASTPAVSPSLRGAPVRRPIQAAHVPSKARPTTQSRLSSKTGGHNAIHVVKSDARLANVGRPAQRHLPLSLLDIIIPERNEEALPPPRRPYPTPQPIRNDDAY